MRALIVGGSGAIGSAVARHACTAGIDTHVALRATSGVERLAGIPAIARHVVDLADADSVAGCVRRLRPDWIVMAAFPTDGHATDARSRNALLTGMDRNLLGLMGGLANAGHAGTLTWIGSAMAYAAPGDGTSPPTFRGAVKAAESLLAARLAADAGIPLTELRVFTGYGPFEQRDRLVPRLLRAALLGERVPLAPVPARRDWVHYDDIARACVASAARSTSGRFDVSSGRTHDTREVATRLEGIVGRPLVAAHDYPQPEHYGDAPQGTLAASGLDWAPRIDLAEGLERAWQWACGDEGRRWLLRESVVAA